MRNKKWLLGIAALVLVFGLTLMGCPAEEKDDDPPASSLPAAVNSVKITGLASYNGKYVMVQGQVSGGGTSFMGLADYTSAGMKLVKIADGTATVPLYVMASGGGSLTAYGGNDSDVALMIGICNDETITSSPTFVAQSMKTASFSSSARTPSVAF